MIERALPYATVGLFAILAAMGARGATVPASPVPVGRIEERIAIPGIWPAFAAPEWAEPETLAFGKLLIVVSYEDPVRIAAYDEHGRRVWSRPFSVVESAVALEGDDLIFSARTTDAGEALVYDVSVASGRARWTQPATGGIVGADRNGIVVASDPGIVAYDRTGKKLWSAPAASIDRRVMLANDLVIGLGSIPGADDEPERGATMLSSYRRRDGTMIAAEEVPSDVDVLGSQAIVQYTDPVVKGFESNDDPRFQAACCASELDVTDLRRAVPSATASPEFAAERATIAPDMRANVDRSLTSSPCPDLVSNAIDPGAFAAGDERVYYVGRAHRVYALSGTTIHGPPVDDTCLTSLGNIGRTLAVWHGASLALLRTSADGLTLVPLHLPLHRRDVVAALAGRHRFYFATASSLYGVDAETEREAVWPIAGCVALEEPVSEDREPPVACSRASGAIDVFDLGLL